MGVKFYYEPGLQWTGASMERVLNCVAELIAYPTSRVLFDATMTVLSPDSEMDAEIERDQKIRDKLVNMIIMKGISNEIAD